MFTKENSAAEPENDNLDWNSVKTHLEVEAYNPDTLEFIRSFSLDMHPDPSKVTNEEESKAVSEGLQKEIGIQWLKRVNCTTDGHTLALSFRQKMYMFDLNTGKRIDKVLVLPQDTSFNGANGVFWSHNAEGEYGSLTSYTITGFQNTHGEKIAEKEKLEVDDHSSYAIANKILDTLVHRNKMVENDIKKLQIMDPSNTGAILRHQSTLFRGDNSITISRMYLNQLATAFKNSSKHLSEEEPANEHQEETKSLSLLIDTTLKAMKTLGISLESLLGNKEESDKFLGEVVNSAHFSCQREKGKVYSLTHS